MHLENVPISISGLYIITNVLLTGPMCIFAKNVWLQLQLLRKWCYFGQRHILANILKGAWSRQIFLANSVLHMKCQWKLYSTRHISPWCLVIGCFICWWVSTLAQIFCWRSLLSCSVHNLVQNVRVFKMVWENNPPFWT